VLSVGFCLEFVGILKDLFMPGYLAKMRLVATLYNLVHIVALHELLQSSRRIQQPRARLEKKYCSELVDKLVTIK
jgi:hypothetical protein